MAAATASPFRLLELPAELRNQIYRYAVVEQDWVHLNDHNSSEAAVLQTCRQIRSEAGPIYYGENVFAVTLTDYKVRPQPAHWVWDVDRAKTFKLRNEGSLDWENLKEWFRLYHEGKSRCLARRLDNGDDKRMVLSKIWDIVKGMVLLDVDWNTTEMVLEKFKEGIEVKQGDWTFD